MCILPSSINCTFVTRLAKHSVSTACQAARLKSDIHTWTFMYAGVPTLSNLLFSVFHSHSLNSSAPARSRCRNSKQQYQPHLAISFKIAAITAAVTWTAFSLAQPGYPLLCRCTESAAPPQYWWHLIINLSPAWSGLTNSNTHRLIGAVCCVRHQLSLLSTTRSSLTRIVSATRSTSCHPSTEATGLAQHRVQPPRRLVSHGIIPECLLHSNRQLNSILRLSGQNSDFSCGHSSNTFHLSSESKNSHLSNVPCLGRYGNCLITNLSSRFTNETFPHW